MSLFWLVTAMVNCLAPQIKWGQLRSVSSGKLFQTAGAACEKAWSAKARLVRSSCSKFLPQDRKLAWSRHWLISTFSHWASFLQLLRVEPLGWPAAQVLIGRFDVFPSSNHQYRSIEKMSKCTRSYNFCDSHLDEIIESFDCRDWWRDSGDIWRCRLRRWRQPLTMFWLTRHCVVCHIGCRGRPCHINQLSACTTTNTGSLTSH